MSDAQILGDALNEAYSTLNNSEEAPKEEASSQAEEKTPEAQEVKEEPKAVVEDSKEQPEPEVEEETFTDKKLTFEELPEELKPIYRDWQKQYTQKRQAEKEYIKKLEQQMEEAKTNSPDSNSQSQQLNRQQQQALTPEQLEAYLSTREQNTYLATQEKQFLSIDDRLNADSPEHDEWMSNAVIAKLSTMRDAYEAENKTVIGFDFVGEGKKLIKAYDERLQKQVKQALSNQTKTKQDKITQARKNNPNAKFLDSKTEKNMNLDEAIEAAFEGK